MSTSSPSRLRPVDLGKPRMRGWLHAYAFFVAVAAGVVLCSIAATRPGWTALISCTVYSVTVCGLFGTSALYHRRVWSERGYRTMRRLDHSMIFVFIAGTYTPFCLLLLSGRSAAVLLVIVWSGAVVGVALKLVWPHAPRWVSAPLYLALGWVAVAVLPDILDRGGATVLALLVAGGAAYSVGAVCYALRRPNPWPTVFGHHELFHACTLVAAICHHVAIYFALFA
ncbi:hemolysin III family protein [Plantactinospora solaniradicis]|uniref:Hemolysin III family protein n=1 Tax=Plantactinospora solaniradicis TaxID=1723736 RepID=A0ABW1KF54_9ACTN